MDKDKVLPYLDDTKLDEVVDPEHCYRIWLSRLGLAELRLIALAQRDADWKKVEILVEALEAIAHFHLNPSDTATLGLCGCQDLAKETLAKLDKKEDK